jgi:formyl-CoA transferase/CoA:oxalate CoA-transferase
MLPIEGLRVLDFSHYADGPACALMLAEAGADVIKIEPLSGDPFRAGMASAVFYNFNRNKRSLAVDLQSPEGKEVALKLASTADIIVESFTPGVADTLGIGYAELSRISPRLIYCSISGFGQTGPYSQRPAHDPVIQAVSGFMSTTGEPGRPPVRVAPGVIGLGTAFIASYGIMLALMERQKTGRGQLIDAAFFDTAVFFISPFITGYSLTGLVMPRMGSSNPTFVPYQCFEAADRYVFIGVTTEKFWHRFCEALGLEELENDPRYASNIQRLLYRDELVEKLASALKKFHSSEILSKLKAADVPCAPLLEIPEVVDDSQVQAREMLFDMEYPGVGPIKLAHIPVKASGIESIKNVRAPLLGEHTQTILRELGYTDYHIDVLAEKGVLLRD